jgi:WD40 repeat protein
VASAGGDGVRIWDWSTLDHLAHLPVGPTRCAFFVPGDSVLVTAAKSGLVRWPTKLDSEQGTLTIGPPEVLDKSSASPGHFWASADPHGKWIASTTGGPNVRVFPWRDPEDRAVLKSKTNAEYPVISPDEKWVAAGISGPDPGGAGYQVWDMQTGEVVARLAHPAGSHVAMAAFSPDGKWLVTGRGRDYRLWEVGSWELRRSIPKGFSVSGALVFSRDGRLLAVAHSPRAIRLFDTATWQQLATLESSVPDNIWRLSFNLEADKLAAACWEHVILIWDLREIRRQLAAMQLDWDQPPYPSPQTPGPAEPLRVHVEMGDLQRN